MKNYSLAYITSLRPDGTLNVILGKQKTGMWTGYYNGFGGEIRDEQPLWKEVQEQILSDTGIAFSKKRIVNSLIGKINFNHTYNPEHDCTVAIYLIQEPVFIESDFWISTKILLPEEYHFITETDSMKPYLFTSNALPYQNMPPLDQCWLPRVMSSYPTYASLLIDATGAIIKYERNDYANRYDTDE